jgi:hypothetical protein
MCWSEPLGAIKYRQFPLSAATPREFLTENTFFTCGVSAAIGAGDSDLLVF